MDLNKVVNRAISIVKSPQSELAKVKTEQITANELITQYIAVLAVIPAVAGIIGMGIVGVQMPFFGTYRYSIVAAIVYGIITYVLSIAGVYITALVINALAPNFASKKSDIQAMKLAAYAETPGLLGGIFNLIPMLGILSLIASLYGLYILYLGIPQLMETPREKALIYTVAIIVVMIVITFIIGAITGAVMQAMSPMPFRMY